MTGYLIVVAVVFGANLLPVFGPPTWALLVFFRISSHLMPIPLVIAGAIAAVSGRLLLALAFSHLRGRLSSKQSNNLQAAGTLLHRDRKRSILGLGLFALSPVPSAQLFEAAGLLGVALAPLTAAFFAGRLVSYSLYVAGAGAAKNTGIATLLKSSFTSPWGIAVQLLLLVGIVGLTRIDWARHLARHDHAAQSLVADAGRQRVISSQPGSTDESTDAERGDRRERTPNRHRRKQDGEDGREERTAIVWHDG